MIQGTFITNLLTKYLDKNEEVFDKYLEEYDGDAHKCGMKRCKNSIRLMKLDFDNEVIDNLNDVTFERFVEWRLINQCM